MTSLISEGIHPQFVESRVHLEKFRLPFIPAQNMFLFISTPWLGWIFFVKMSGATHHGRIVDLRVFRNYSDGCGVSSPWLVDTRVVNVSDLEEDIIVVYALHFHLSFSFISPWITIDQPLSTYRVLLSIIMSLISYPLHYMHFSCCSFFAPPIFLHVIHINFNYSFAIRGMLR